MPLTLTRIQTRPSTDIPFFFETNLVSKDYEEYLKKTYRDTGKILGFDRTISDDKLTVTTNLIWESSAAFAEYYTDPICIEKFLTVSAEYEQTNNIKSESLADTGFVRPTRLEQISENNPKVVVSKFGNKKSNPSAFLKTKFVPNF
jgi:hypothetical protein